MTNIQKLEWSTVQRKVNDLIPQTINPRKISDKQLSDLRKSFEKFNLVEIPAIDLDGKILAGHQRIKVLQILGRGEELIDVRIPNRQLAEQEAKEYLIGSNKLGGDWDYELLKSFDFETLEFAGFDKIELGELWDKEKEVSDDNFNIDRELKKIKTPITKLGDVIILGQNKIICGDSTKQETLTKLFGKEQASMICSDPVYNLKGGVDYNSGVGGNADYGGNVNDTRTLEEYRKFLKDSMVAALLVSKKDIHVFYFCDQIYIGIVQELYRELGIENKRVCLWLKNGHSCVPKVYCNKVYEPAVMGVRGRPHLSESITDLNEVMNKEFGTGNELLAQVDNFIEIWTAKRVPAKDYQHATTKPCSLYEKAIKRCTKLGDIILDSFLGSGSSLIAGEMLGRKVYGCELEPVFCDLIVRRWEALTGQKAVYEKEQKTD